MKKGKLTLSEERAERRNVVLKQIKHKAMIARIQPGKTISMSITEWLDYRENLSKEARKQAIGKEKRIRIYEEIIRINNWLEIAKRVTL